MLFSKTIALAFFTYFLSLRFDVVFSLVTGEQPGYYIDGKYIYILEPKKYIYIKNSLVIYRWVQRVDRGNI
jgi:hypothetical protein